MNVTVNEYVRGSRRSVAWFALGALAVVIAVVFRDSWAALVNTWSTDTTYTHGFLIIPISIGLIWMKRAELARVDLRPSWTGLLLLVAALSLWLLGRLVHLRLLEQIGLIGALQALVPLVLGTAATRLLVFPVCFLWFAVPFGKELVPPLMEITADLSVVLLQLTGVPVYREGMLLQIPAGTYEVARACSGIKFLTAAVALGTLFAYLNYRGLRKRLAFVGIAIVVAILSNGLRAYLLVLIGHLTDMTFRHDQWHIVLGYVVFGISLLLLFYVGARYRDDVSGTASAPPPPDALRGLDTERPSRWQVPLLGLLLVAAAVVVRTVLASGGSTETIAAMSMPLEARDGWIGEAESPVDWRPHIGGGAKRLERSYRRGGEKVDLFVEVYPLPSGDDAEMISYRNSIQDDANERLYVDRVHAPQIDGYPELRIRETRAPGPPARLVWYWYDVAGETIVSPTRVKVAEAMSLLRHGRAAQRVIVLSTPEDDEVAARARLREFVDAHRAQLFGRGP